MLLANLRVTWNPTSPTLSITSARVEGNQLILSGTGPATVGYLMRGSTDLGTPVAGWTFLGSGTFDDVGTFTFSVAVETATPQRYFQLQLN
jgi:hypothetical protein